MSQDEKPDEKGRVQIDPNPTPENEAQEFDSPDDRREQRKNAHSLALLARQQGWIGRITGSTNDAINVAWFLLTGLIIALFVCFIVCAFVGVKDLAPTIDKLITAISTVGGFIFGAKQAPDK